MNRRFFALALVCLAALQAQDNPPPKCSISGTVEDSVSHQPLEGFRVSLGPGHHSAVTDPKGNFEFKDLDPGTYRFSARLQFAASPEKVVSVTSGQDLSGIRLKVEPLGTIVGTVTDENGEPLQKADVSLVARDYYRGKLRYVLTSATRTDDKGDYTLERAKPGHRYLVYASRNERRLDAISKVPANPKLRKKVFESAYYGGSDRPEGAQVMIVRPGERKEGIDFKLRRTQAWCIDGVVQDGGRPAQATFSILETQPHFGFSPSADAGLFGFGPGGRTGDDGKFRICDLHPGEYALTTFVFGPEGPEGGTPTMFAVTEAAITDGDVHDLKINARPRVPILGEVVWNGEAPKDPVAGEIEFFVEPLGRPGFMGEIKSFNAKSSISGKFSFPGLFIDEYKVKIWGVPADSYLKEASYAGIDIRSAPMVPGSRGDSTLRIVLARDGGVIQAKVVDKDGQPIPDSSLIIMAADITTPALLADSLIRASTDQNGNYTSARLAPGKYFVIATDANIDFSVDSIDKLWAVRTRAKSIDLTPSGTVSVSVELTTID
jgi:hypothetical protein